MRRNFKRRSSSVGSKSESTTTMAMGVVGLSSDEKVSLDKIKFDEKTTTTTATAEDLEIAKQLFSSLLYMKDSSGRMYLHTDFKLSWAKALLDRAKNLDDGAEHHFADVVGTRRISSGARQRQHQQKNSRNRKGSHHHNESTTSFTSTRNNNNNNNNNPTSSTTLMQRRFLLQPDQESGYNPFHRAIVEGNLAAVLLFLRHAMDTTSTERLTQRPMTVLHAAEANNSNQNKHSTNNQNNNNNNNNNNTLLLAMASATDHEGMTPLRLLGQLQQSELLRCRKYLSYFQPAVDRNATIRLRSRQRRSSFDDGGGGNNNNDDDTGIDFFSANADLLQIDRDSDDDDNDNEYTDQSVSYACEVVTFGRPHHCALGVVQGGSSFSSSSSSTFCPQRVQDFAQECVGRDNSAMAVAAATYHTLVVTKKGELYSFGVENCGGRLGLGDQQTQQCPLPKRVLGALQRRKVVSVAAAENHSLCVTSLGGVYSWGSNRFGQLGDVSGNASAIQCGSRSLPRRVEDLKQHPCVAVAAGEKHSVALSRKGEVYVWGDNASGQLGVSRRSGIQKVQRVEALWASSTTQSNSPKIAIAIAAAEQSTLVLTTGSPSSGLSHVNTIYEFGHGNHVPVRVHFDVTKASNNGNQSSSFSSRFNRIANPTAIACARYHNAAITSDGLVYTWGLRAESLGRGNNNKSLKQPQRRNSLPQLVTGMLPERGGGLAVAIAASGSHTAVVCNNGALFTWGTTDEKNVLGHDGCRWCPNPKRVPGVHRAVDVAVAKEHTILLIGASFPAIPKNDTLLSLEVSAARKVAEYVDLFNVIPILIMAERTEVRILNS
ncbi:MAG: alpha-tubulin suppressor-like RCC1 family protein [Bacillariaceae sp.]|jgi:alpha-tubulin suppressor-like RCC1 family protein